MARWLIVAGIVLIVLGLAWPLLAKFGLGQLSGDIRIERDGFVFYFPLVSGLIVSVVLSLVLSLILWLIQR